MRHAMILAAALLLAGCPYRTQIYRNPAASLMQRDASGQPVFDANGEVVFGKRMGVDRASAQTIDLGTLAADCDTGVIASIDEVRGFHGLNIFTGSHRSLEVWCGVAPAEAPAEPAPPSEPDAVAPPP